METNRLRQFSVVYETRNLRKAAEILNISHSALSKSLKVLQSEINIKLLVQDGRGIDITDEGTEFIKKAREILDLESRIFKQITGEAGLIKIASFESFTTHLLGTKWNSYFPGTPLQLHELSTGRIEAAVSESIVDIGITYEPIPTRGLEFLFVGKIRMGIFHRKFAFKKTQFSDLPFAAPLLPSQGSPNAMHGLDGWPDHEVPRKIQFRVDLLESGLALARSGMAAIFIPRFVARIQNESLLDSLKLEEFAYPKGVNFVERRCFIIVKAEKKRDKIIRKLRELLTQECLS